jgi:YVTN family beta-propeller protein
MKRLVIILLLLLPMFAVAQKVSEIPDLLREGAKNGDPAAEFNVGLYFYEGLRFKKKRDKARKWFQRSAQHGHAEGQYYFAFMLEEGKGGRKDRNKAIKWYRMAAEQGHARAADRLAILTGGSAQDLQANPSSQPTFTYVLNYGQSSKIRSGNRLLVSTDHNTTVSVISNATHEVVSTIPVGHNASNLAITPNGEFVYVAGLEEKMLTVISTASNEVVASMEVGRKQQYSHAKALQNIAITPDGKYVYVGRSVVSTASNTIVSKFNFWGNELTMSPDGNFLYAWSAVGLSVNSTATNTHLQVYKLGQIDFPQMDVVARPDGELLYIAGPNDGKVWVFSTKTNETVARIEVEGQPHDLEISPDGLLVYVSSFGPGAVSIISTTTNELVGTVDMVLARVKYGRIAAPHKIAVSPDGSLLYMLHRVAPSFGVVMVVSTNTNSIVAMVEVGVWPIDIAISPDGELVYVTNFEGRSATVISARTNKVVATIPVGIRPLVMVMTPHTSPVRTGSAMPWSVPEEPPDEQASAEMVDPASQGICRIYGKGWTSNAYNLCKTFCRADACTATKDPLTGKFIFGAECEPRCVEYMDGAYEKYSLDSKAPNADNAVTECPCWSKEELSTVSDLYTEDCSGDQARALGRIHGGRDDKNYRLEGAYAQNLECVIRFNKGPWYGNQPVGGEVDRKQKLTEAEQHYCIATIIDECKSRGFGRSQ